MRVAVGTPVTRHPLHRSRRAIFPHRAPQSYSLAQKNRLSRKPPISCLANRNRGPRERQALQKPMQLQPGQASPLASSIQPLVQQPHHLPVESPEGSAVADSTKVVIVTTNFPGHFRQEQLQWQAAVGLEPVLAGFDAGLQLLARRAPPHPGRSFAVGFPIKLETEEGETAFAARMEAAEAQLACLLRGHLQGGEFLQPFR
jgi:hypothetical protein